MIDERLKIWAAGLFDGEGSALIERIGVNRQSLQIVVAVSGTDERITDPIIEVWGGHHRKNRDLNTWARVENTSYRLDCTVYFSREEAKVFLADILPYLRGKQEEVAIVLQAILAQEKRIKEKGLRGSSFTLEPFYTRLQTTRGTYK